MNTPFVASVLESQTSVFDVVVWVPEVTVQRTVSPTLMVLAAGLNLKFSMLTSTVFGSSGVVVVGVPVVVVAPEVVVVARVVVVEEPPVVLVVSAVEVVAPADVGVVPAVVVVSVAPAVIGTVEDGAVGGAAAVVSVAASVPQAAAKRTNEKASKIFRLVII